MTPKFNYIRSKKLMTLYRTIPCQMCMINDGTVCGAHSNQAKHGHGRGIKASDIYCASLCSQCHYEIDQGKKYTREQKVRFWDEAHSDTVRWLVDSGAWPLNIEPPIC